MILGIGIDIIEIARIENSYERFGRRFVDRILLPDEVAYCLSHRKPGPFLAARFAAKEAISKALGTGFHGFWFTDIEIKKNESGKPIVYLSEKIISLFSMQPDRFSIQISITHELPYIVSFAVAIKTR